MIVNPAKISRCQDHLPRIATCPATSRDSKAEREPPGVFPGSTSAGVGVGNEAGRQDWMLPSILTTMKPTRKRPSASSGGAKPSVAKPGKPTKLRIIGGEMRGRLIDYHGASFTRPMKDNIRENLFNILGQAIRGSICFDLFAGTGALSFESLSRGASASVMIEQNRRAVSFIERTAAKLGVADRIELLTGDTFRLAGPRLASPEDDTPWIVFLCPPYALWESSLAELQRLIRQSLENAPLGSVLVAEMEKSFDPEQLPPGQWDFRVYGGTRLGFIEAEARCGLQLDR